MYRLLFDVVFRRLDPERAHELAFGVIRGVARVPVLRGVVARLFASPPSGAVRLWGRTFPSAFGLAAGFDKNAVGVAGLTMLGFGFVEVGTVTAQPQPGNERPRLWRVLDQRALRNRMGFNNEGSAAVAARLRRLRATPAGRRLVVGVNIGKTKVTPAEQAPADYATSASRLAPYADYLVVNVSSPNTPGLRDLQAVESLRPILEATRVAADEATATAGRPAVPLLVKIAPDLSDADVDAVADLVAELGLEGVVAVNTTVAHDLGPGGLSGPPVLARGLDVVARLRERLGSEVVIIGVGGITTPADAREYLAVGATLVQGYTGFIYQGPGWAARIGRALAADAVRRGSTTAPAAA
ncbi:quinone-dependent dihydroorotate dehydrogenase [Cellulomonas fimi]|uniref:Dihydroorotate dehydrogenase (quinone) n=1 Tax=Cellulomonas fimi (strain ATCC 484 / DSM 20113 / JCM 1341 / CCUG 24087 / LMG 16345 / NBRC 15513 / NCIMB 8980 / NCTC 7547 / NRS-133) TaxID=590998 RepID=F4H236_CELFA|nr:quinone-dependent dihydroorotate dehydrogenase [Cellulomonas fimi]AEE46333.1 dihydroorotate dehydrogenase [Cellulomonas fimi ATCC 484]NNH08478.1 quinone-dependent dihydroorotate dehydrogenase [Cellulomonas fimi]VEH32566.1 Dihydroorotate dehydrogenase (quinone) [Cellulomonas fimi]